MSAGAAGRRWCALALGWLALATASAVLAHEGAEPVACFVSPEEMIRALSDPAKTIEAPTGTLGQGFWQEGVYYLPFTLGGSYDREVGGAPNVAPRQWLTQSFLADNPDTYDFVLVLTNFQWDAGPQTRGLYWSIKNDVAGIGVPLIDLSSQFGSNRLQGYIDGMRLADYRLPDGSLDTRRVREILNHELGHRWLVHPRFDDGSGPSTALLGRDGAHWSYLLDSEASFMYGSDWRPNGDGTFTATSIRQRFSPFDLYLMGMIPPSEVPPSHLLEAPGVDVTQIPGLGDTVTATSRTVTVDHIVAAEGPRIPDAGMSQKQFRIAVVYLYDPDFPLQSQDLQLASELKDFWRQSFFRETRGRAVIDLEPRPPVVVAPAVDLQRALEWLANRQGVGGLWRDSAVTVARDTAEAIEALGRVGGFVDAVDDAVRTLPSTEAASTELRMRRLEGVARWGSGDFSAAAAAAAAEAEPGGGFAAFPRYSPDTVTTARAVRALAAAGRAADAQPAWSWLVARRNADQAWGWQEGSISSVSATVEVLMAARVLDPQGFFTRPEVAAAFGWLLARRVDGGVGDGLPNVAQTALFLQLMIDQTVDQAVLQQAIDFLAGRQQADGSWESSVYKTALATAALQSFLLPDPYVEPDEVVIDPADPYADEAVRMVAAIRNNGTPLDAGTPYAWQVVPRGQTLPFHYLVTGTLPALTDIGFATIDDELPAGALPPGEYDLRLIIDPDRTISEKNRDNNLVVFPLRIKSHPAGVDLQLRPSELMLSPDEITSMPQAVQVAGTVRNVGLTPAAGVTMAVYDGDPRTGELLGTTMVDVPALGSALFEVGVLVYGARPHELWVVADPDLVTGDLDTINNRASRVLLLRLNTDLEIVPDSFVVEPETGDVGTPRTLYAQVHNGGTTTVENFQVAFRYEVDAQSYLIQQLLVPGPLGPDETVDVGVQFTPNLDGPLTLTVIVDPLNSLGDVDFGDNAASRPLEVGANTLPNLRLELGGVDVDPALPLQGASAHVVATIANPTRNAVGPFIAQLWLDAVGSGTLLAEEEFASLAAQSSVEIGATWNVTEPQNRLLYAIADPANAIEEFDEEDNSAFISADVQTLPDLATHSGSVTLTPDFPKVGDDVRLDVEILNAGDQPALATTVELLDAAGTVLGTQPLPALAGHTGATVGFEWSPPAGPGDYALTVRMNVPPAFAEMLSTNNQITVSVAVQDGDLYVSNQIFSPNGDGIKDATAIFFRLPAETVEIVDRDDRVVRTFPAEGIQSVVWDGLSDRQILVRDGVYRVRMGAGGATTWVAVDNNLTSVTADVQQRLMTGFLEPQFPGGGADRSRFTSLVVSSQLEEIYAIEHFQSDGGLPETWTLRRFDGDEMVEVGEWPLPYENLISADATGTTFLVGGEGYAVVRYPGPEIDSISTPGGWGFTPYLSPDGRYAVWASSWSAELYVSEVETGDQWRFDAEEQGFYSPCGYSVSFTRAQTAVIAVPTWSGNSFFYEIDLTAYPPAGRITALEGSFNYCGSGGTLAPSTAGDLTGGGGVLAQAATQTAGLTPDIANGRVGGGSTDLSVAADAEERTITVVAPADGSLPEDITVVQSGDFWNGSSFGFYGSQGLAIRRFDLDSGEPIVGYEMDLGEDAWSTPPVSLSNDGNALAMDRTDDGGGEGIAAPLALGVASNFLPASPPESFEKAGRPELVGALDVGIALGEGQNLLDWRREESRFLPFALRDALWTAADKYLIGDVDIAWRTNDLVPYFTPAANLTTRLRPRILFGDAGIDLWVVATDIHLDHYVLDYADLDDPTLTFHQIGLPSDEPLFGERWGTWLPPGNGRYRVRLVAHDRAGNVRSTFKRVVWNGDNDIANLYLEHRYVSPRASAGVKDALIFHYTVLRPANLDFEIVDEGGNVVAEIPVAADVTGQRTTTFGGDDGAGNPLPDGRYELRLGAASWPFVIDNTPPQVALRIDPTQLLQTKANSFGIVDKDLETNEVYAQVIDVNLDLWEFGERYGDAVEWNVVDQGQSPIDRNGERSWLTFGAHQLVRRELRLRATDLAGNETVVARQHREEKLRLAEIEPGCRGSIPPCIYPTRPLVENLTDVGGLLSAPAHTLDLHYDTLLVQSTVWADTLDLRLEYRPISLTGLPTGPWQTATIERRPTSTSRFICAPEAKSKPEQAACAAVGDRVEALYWNHPGMALQPLEVRLSATNLDNQPIVSPSVEYWPAMPLTLEYLGIDDRGDLLRLRNISAGSISGIQLTQRIVLPDGTVQWKPLVELPPNLQPTQFSEHATGCLLLDRSGAQIRAEGTGSLGERAVSLPIVVPPREGSTRMAAASFVPGSCALNQSEAPISTATSRGFAGREVVSPCALPPPPFPEFWESRAAEPWSAAGRVTRDPVGVDVMGYELLVNGAPFVSITGPMDGLDWNRPFDLSHLAEGDYTITERFTYAPGAEGLLGRCPQTFPLKVDRTPPTVEFTEPEAHAFICPDDLMAHVEVAGEDVAQVFEALFLDGSYKDGPDVCGPFGAAGDSFSFKANEVAPGDRFLQVRSIDVAGNATCVARPVTFPILPKVLLSAQPLIFSPVNSLGRPTAVGLEFTTRSPGLWEGDVQSMAGDVIRIMPPTPTDGVTEIDVAWEGTDTGGALMPDGPYRVSITATSPCLAQDTARTVVTLDTTPPELLLSAPVANQVVGSVLDVRGLVRDLHFESYQVEIFSVDSGTEWLIIATSSQATTQAQATLATWRTDGYPAGEYLVRVIATDRPGNQTISAEIPVRIRERRLIRRFEREPVLFSPNADTILDSQAIRFELFQDALVTLQVIDADDAVVATLLESELRTGEVEHEVSWAGQADLGGIAPDADYILRLLAEDAEVPATLDPEQDELTSTVDTTPPALAVTSPVVDALVGLPTAIVGSLAEIHPDRYQLALDSAEHGRQELISGGGEFDSQQLLELDGRPDGPYQLVYEADDRAGNRSAMTQPFVIDNTAPAVIFVSPPTGQIRDTTSGYVRLDGEITEDHLVAWSFAFAPGDVPEDGHFVVIEEEQAPEGGNLRDGAKQTDWDASQLADGVYTLRLDAEDALGRRVEARILFTVDNTPPVVEIHEPGDGSVLSSSIDMAGVVEEANLTQWRLTLRKEGETIDQPLASGVEEVTDTDLLAPWDVLPADGVYTLTLWAGDKAGHESETTSTVTISVQPLQPPVLLSATVQNLRDVALVWQPGPGPTPNGYRLYRNGVDFASTGNDELEWLDAGRPDGLYTYTVRAVAANGEESADSNALEAVISNALPIARITYPADGSRVSDQLEVVGTAWRDGGLSLWQLWVAPEGGSFALLGSGTARVLADYLATWDTALPQFPNGFYLLKLEVADIYGHQASHQVRVEVDNEEPVAPVLTFAASSAMDPDSEINDIHVEWTLDPVPVDLAGYYLYRNGQLANAPGPVVGNTRPFLLPGLDYDDKNLPDGTYVYYVTAADNAGNESAASNESPPIVIDTRRPHAVIVDPLDGHEFEDSVVLIAETPDLDVVSVRFEYRAEGATDWIALGETLTRAPWRMPFAPGAIGPYEVRPIAADGVGEDPAPESIVVIATDLPPGGLTDLSLRVDGGSVHLTWQAVADPLGDLAGYHVYRDGVRITTDVLPETQLTYEDTGRPDGYWYYEVRAIDDGGNESYGSPSREAYVVTPAIRFHAPLTADSTAALDAYVPAYYDEVELYQRDALGDDILVATIANDDSNVLLPPHPLAMGYNLLSVRGRSEDGNRTKLSAPIRLLRHLPPATPGNFNAVAAGSDVTLTWQPVADPALEGYDLARNGSALAFSQGPLVYDGGSHTLTATHGNLAGWQRMVDGNFFTGMSVVTTGSLTTPFTFEWRWPTPTYLSRLDLRFGANYPNAYDVHVEVDGEWSWWNHFDWNWTTSAQVPLEVEVTGLRFTIPAYTCYNCSIQEIQPQTAVRSASSPYLDPGMPLGAMPYEVASRNRYGQASAPAAAIALVGVTAPEPPRDLAADAVGCDEIAVDWQPPATEPAVFLGYRLYRATGAGPWMRIAEVDAATLTFLDQGLADGTLYRYRATTLAEISGIAVESAPSNEDDATTSCATPPPPVLLVPTVAGSPIVWPADQADVGGRAWPGSQVTLLHDGSPIATFTLPAIGAERRVPLPGYYSSLQLAGAAGPGAIAAYVAEAGSFVIRRLDVDAGTYADIAAVDPRDPTLSADGSRLAFVASLGGRRDLFLYEAAGGASTQLTDDPVEEWAPHFLPDGRTLVFVTLASGIGNVVRLDVESGARSVLTSWNDNTGFSSVEYSHDGRFVALATYQGPKVVDTVDGTWHDVWTWTYPVFSGSPFSPDGSRLVFSTPEWNPTGGRLYRYDLRNWSYEDISTADGELAPAFLDGGALSFWRYPGDGTARLISRSLLDGQERVLVDGAGPLAPVSEGPLLESDGAGGVFFALGEELVRLQQPSGSFVAPNVPLHVGSNFFTATQVFAGETQEAEQIEVDVSPDAFGDAVAEAVHAAPAHPLIGQSVAIEGVYRNEGGTPLYGLRATLLRITPAGDAELIASEQVDLYPGDEERLRWIWDTAGQTGSYTFRMTLDPSDEIRELDESNNAAQRIVTLQASQGVQATIAVEQPIYQVGELVAVEATVSSNAFPAATDVELLIETAGGEPVASLGTWSWPEFGFDSEELMAPWATEGFVPGGYRARVVARQGAAIVAQAAASFALEARIELTAEAVADRELYTRGETANLIGRVRHLGDVTVLDATVWLIVEPMPSGPAVASQQRHVAALSVGDQRTFRWAWPTDVAPGTYDFRVVVLASDGDELAASEPAAFVVGPVGAALLGDLRVAPSLVEPGNAFVFDGSIRNEGDVSLLGATARVEILDPRSGAELAELDAPADFLAGASTLRTWPYVPDMTALRPYVAILSAVDAGGTAQQLATTTFTLADLTPPVLEWLGPRGAVCTNTFPIRVRATDTFSEVVEVGYSVDALEQQLPMLLETVEDTIWLGYIFSDGSRTTPYQLTFRAKDGAGNDAVPLVVDYLPLVDTEPPVIDLDAPAEASCVAGPAAVTFDATDVNLTALRAWIDEQPYVSGAPIGDGSHELRIRAEDACNAHVELVRRFTVDSAAPVIAVSVPPAGVCATGTVSATFSATDTNLLSVTATLNGAPYVSGTPIGNGVWQLRVRAEDTCGQVVEEVHDFTVDSAPPVLAVTAPAPNACSTTEVSPTFSATDTNLLSVTATLNGAPYLSGTPIGDGTWQLRVRAEDTCGQVVEEVHDFTVDTAPPALIVSVPPPDACSTGVVSATFSATDTNLESVTATLNGAPYVSGTPIGNGAWQLLVRAEDTCGNVVEQTHDFTVDSAPPELTVDAPPPESCLPGPVSATFSATDTNLVSLTATLNGEPYLSGDPIGDGTWELRVRAEDSCGAVVEEVHNFTVDSAAPVLDLQAPAADSCVQDPTFATWTATDANLGTVEAWLDGAPYVAGTPIAKGAHTLLVRAGDACGNSVEQTRTFTVDAAAPVLTVTAPALDSCQVGPVAATFAATDTNLVSVEAWLNGAPYLSGTPIADGEHSLRVSAADSCQGVAEDLRFFIVDSVAPAVAVTGVENGETYPPGPVTGQFTVADTHLVEQGATLDGAPVGSPFTVEEPGSHEVVAWGVDCAGTRTEVRVTFTIAGGDVLDLLGDIVAPADLFHGEPLEAQTLVVNQGSALPGTTFVLRLVDPNGDTVVDSASQLFDVAVDQQLDLQWSFATDALTPRTYRLELRAQGTLGGQPFDIELDRADVELLPTVVEIPTLDTWALLLMSLLLFAAGCFLLRPAFLRGSTMNGSRNERGSERSRRGRRLGLWALVCLSLPLSGRLEAQEAGGACEGRLPTLRRLVQAEGAVAGTAPAMAALRRDLAIEEALWREEEEQRAEELARKGLGRERLDAAAQKVTSRLEALRLGFEEKRPIEGEALEALTGCLSEDAAGVSPISVALTPRHAELAHREAAAVVEGAAPPEGYLAPPSEALRALLASARAEDGVIPRKALNKDLNIDGDAIAAQALALDNDPVKIYAFVLEKIRPAHYFGAVRGAEATLNAGEGNDADQAALLAALLRAADLPARVAWGVVEIAVADLLDHFGARDAAELERTMTAAGIPWSPVAVGGQVRAYRLNRAWCEVYLPYANFRGVVLDDSGTTWLGLDPQLKPRRNRPSGGALANAGIVGADFVASYLEGGSCTPPLERVDACALPSAVLAGQIGAPWTAAATAPAIPAQGEAVLAAGRVGVVRSVLGYDIEFPESFSHRVRLRARAGARVLLDTTVAATTLAGREASLWFTPATDADRALAAGYGDLWLTPPYLVDVALQLWVEGEELALGAGKIGMGEPFDLEITLLAPSGDSLSFRNAQRAGVPVGFGLAPGRHGYRQPEGGAGNTPEVLAWLVGDYLDHIGDFASRLARVEGQIEVHPFPSFASVASVVDAVGTAGLIERLIWRGVYVDADVVGSRVVASPAAARTWLELVGLESAAQERALFERFGMASVSADSLLILARERGVTVHAVDGANYAAILPGLPFSAAIKSEIEAWVRAGGRALVPAAELDFIEFTGVGYALLDDETGESRWQLAGRLSGGMIAVPPFQVVPGVAGPLQVPQNGPINTKGNEAVAIALHDGNLQISTVDKTLGTESGTLPLRVIVRDRQGRLVSNAPVKFTVLAGGGNFGGATTFTVNSVGGVASAQLTLGRQTSVNPYYLLFPEEQWAQRTDLSVIKAEVNGFGMNDLFYEFGRPDEVTQLQQPWGASLEGLPHISIGTPLLVVPADQHGNPVANADVRFNLQGSSPGAGKGPELIARLDMSNCGSSDTVMAGECPASNFVIDQGSVTGVWAWLVLGEDDTYTVNAEMSGSGGSGTATFTATVRKDFIPTGAAVGWPLILVSRRGQPVGPNGGSAEAYAPGKPTVPLRVSLFVFHEEYGVTECGSGRYCTTPQGTYKTRRLATNGMAGCFPASCGGGAINESATITFSGPGISGSQSSPILPGIYEQAVTMPAEAGRYEVQITPVANVAVPRQPDDPDFINEIVPCGDPACGAQLRLEEVSSANWGTRMVLWTVKGKLDGNPPVVKLGHENRHESETLFPYLVEPADYPALSVAVAFIEDGLVPLIANADGRGPGAATLPVGKIFNNPTGKHQAKVLINAGWVWDPGPGDPISMMVEGETTPFAVIMFDVDVDSDNNNGKSPPDRNDVEEGLEDADDPTAFGKFVFVNHDNDDPVFSLNAVEKPDYAQNEVAGEDNLIPVVIELRPEEGDWSSVQLFFSYQGPPASNLPNGPGQSLGTRDGKNYVDYSGMQVGDFRLWKVDSPTAQRPASAYIEPGSTKTAAQLGLGPGQEKVTLYLEALRGTIGSLTPSSLGVSVFFRNEGTNERVKVTPVMANLGFNNSNAKTGMLRPGVPDGPEWIIDDADEKVEDQQMGFEFWPTDDGATNIVTKNSIEDLAPFIVDIPQKLIDDEWRFALRIREFSGEHTRIAAYPVDRGIVENLDYLRFSSVGNQVLASTTQAYVVGPAPHPIPVRDQNTAFLFKVWPSELGVHDERPVVLELLARDKTSTDWISVDSARLKLQQLTKMFTWWSARGAEASPYTFYSECHPEASCATFNMANVGWQDTNIYPAATRMPDSSEPELDAKLFFVSVHGYNVDLDDARRNAGRVFRRLFWLGFRGNFAAFTWFGNEGQNISGITPFSPNVDNAFRTAPRFKDFLQGQIRTAWQTPPENIYVMAHSLGNHVVMEAMRIFQFESRLLNNMSRRLFNHMILVEPAIWGETFWEQDIVDYDLPHVPATYTVDELRRHSWSFWYNQKFHPAPGAANLLTHSYAAFDFALVSMKIDEYAIRNPGRHFFRESPDEALLNIPRRPVDDFLPTWFDLASSKAVMMGKRFPIYYSHNLVDTAGQAFNPAAQVNVDAVGRYGWPTTSHSAFADEAFFDIWYWYSQAVKLYIPTGQDRRP